MLICCDIIPDKGNTSNQGVIEMEDGIIFVPLDQSSVKVTIKLNIEDTLENNDQKEDFNQNSVLLRLVSLNKVTEWKQVNGRGSEFCLPVTNDAFQIWALEAKGYNACYPANFALFPSELK